MTTLDCGVEITEDTTLDGDLACASGPALVVAADNVTLDLGGHTVSGDAQAPTGGPGILLRSVSGCTVRNGTVEHFQAGVVIAGGERNVVEGLTVQDNIGPADGDFGDGIVLDASTDSRIAGNTVRRNGPFSGISLVEGCHGNEIRDNVVTDNNMLHAGQPSAGRQDMGIRLEGPAANDNKVVGNTVTGSGSSGIVVLPTCVNLDACAETPPNEGNEVAGNTVNHNGTSGRGDGIKLFNVPNPVAPTRNTIIHNIANGNATAGISVDEGATDNRIARNSAHTNGEYDGYDGNTNPACDANQWEANDFGLANQPCVRRPGATAASGLRTRLGAE